jgi:hypothetical protein
MHESVRDLFDKCLREVERPYGPTHSGPAVVVPISPGVKKQHVELRLKHNTIRRVSPDDEARYPSLGVVNEFCVVEKKKQGDLLFDRLRQIDHPVQQNEASRARNFRTTAPLKHISAYLPRIKAPKALIADIAASFYGCALSDPVARSYYRFRDEEGNLYELATLMMGHVAAVEIQQIIASVLAGHRDYVLPEFAAPQGVISEIWVDNIRMVGDESLLKKCEVFLKNSAAACNVSLEIEGNSAEYDFLGATWNHEAGTVEIAKKTREKLPASIPSSMKAGDLEGLVGRLIFVAQITQTPLVRHYWAMKWARRFFNALNAGRLSTQDDVAIPSSARFSLMRWLEASKKPHKVRFSNDTGRTATLFTDASLKGWGGCLVMGDGSIHLVGGAFTSADHGDNINKAEAIALRRSIEDLKNILRTLSRLDVFVDNTSVEANVRRGMCSAQELVEPVRKIWEDVIDCNVGLTIDRVSTELNPADSISRNQVFDYKKLNLAMGMKNTRRNNNNNNSRKGLEERHIVFT